MRRFFPVLCWVMLLALAVPGPGMAAGSANIGLQEVISTVELSFTPGRNGLPPVEDVTADFLQRSTLVGKEGREFRADGQMSLKTATANEPLMFRFEYFRPTTQEIICDGRTLWVHLTENKQVLISDVSDVFNPHLHNPVRDRAVNFLQGLSRISKDFLILFSPKTFDPAGNFILEMTPRRSSVTIAKMFMVVSREAVQQRAALLQGRQDIGIVRQELQFPILSTTVIDPDGNSTTMEFSNFRTNIRLPAIIFNFVVPPTVQVLQAPGRR